MGEVDRRSAQPVRLALSEVAGRDVDGAWWPQTNRVAGELPHLMLALASRVGAVEGIGVNWTNTSAFPNFNAAEFPAHPGTPASIDLHLMVITGSIRTITLLLIPFRTSVRLATLVLREAVALPIPMDLLDTRAHLAARRIVQSAQTQAADGRAKTS
ncbi:DUF5994 family protein [Williamsia phyllosphaerae]|uniref:Polyketide cyclase / dehydrase and lipid transport n=1 Tax=Williamsia phyllosphaerae TaxID=885042 RepID=A0ABQ1UWJ7_9NOCA|nr:DUF5994 family protein [Williamsia phyllosphaerae]GGF28833.1 hypothetical protein GCM10007298_25850 [Williamsia phyllosphaerae]